MKTSSILKLSAYPTLILSLSLLSLAAPACVAGAEDEGEPSAPADAVASDSADTDLADVAKPAPVQPAAPLGVAPGEDLPAKPADVSKWQATSLPANFAWSVTLSATPSSLWPTQQSTLTAVANMDIRPTPYYLTIRDIVTGALVYACGVGTTCSTTVTQPFASLKGYQATIDNGSGGNVQASSSVPTVTWWSADLGLSVGPTNVAVGANTTLTATTDRDITPSPFYMKIFDITTGTIVRSCGNGTSCGTPLTQGSAGTHAYQAFLSSEVNNPFPLPGVVESTPIHYVTWSNGGPSVSLSTPVITGSGLEESVTATASIDVGPTPYWIEIYNEETGVRVGRCGSTNRCEAKFQGGPLVQHLVAFIANDSTALPPANIQASSNVVASVPILG